MKAKDIFGVVVRFFGMAFLYQALGSVPVAVQGVCPNFPHFYFRNVIPSLLMVGWPLLLGFGLIRWAPRIVRFAYADETGPNASPQCSSPAPAR